MFARVTIEASADDDTRAIAELARVQKVCQHMIENPRLRIKILDHENLAARVNLIGRPERGADQGKIAADNRRFDDPGNHLHNVIRIVKRFDQADRIGREECLLKILQAVRRKIGRVESGGCRPVKGYQITHLRER